MAAPETRSAQIVASELNDHPRPATPHASANSAIGAALHWQSHRRAGDPPGRPGGWWILYEPELHLGGDILMPDLAGWKRERMPAMARLPYFTQAPDWLCEVLSPCSATLDRGREIPLYARAGVRRVWIVDPTCNTIESYRLDPDRGLYLLLGTHRWSRWAREALVPFLQGRAVIFIDEVDTTPRLPFSRDDFLTSIRALHDDRRELPARSRLAFCFLGVASLAETEPLSPIHRFHAHASRSCEAHLQATAASPLTPALSMPSITRSVAG
jgi:Uma2 family endonuclease